MYKIAIAPNRKSKTWKNEEYSWDEIVERLSNPVVTQETYEEYQKMDRGARSEIKDVGGYVGGWLKEGRRKSGNVAVRSLVTLDLDFASDTLIYDLELIHGFKGVLVTTHSHSPEKPKYRLILPLSRDVNAEEYQAISRRVAFEIGMEQFDQTTFQPERMMYWSSVSLDGAFECDELDGDILDADEVLAQYVDWTDTSQWPLHDLESAVKTSDKQMEDPKKKKGIVGSFCRVYSISEAIDTFLPDVYKKGNTEDRYTYAGGSTADGLVVYDDTFAYSHHGTDPINGRSVNAFDLVRLHKFGHLDNDAEYESASKQPSYKKMKDFVSDIYEVKLEQYNGKSKNNVDEFEVYQEHEEIPEEAPEEAPEDDVQDDFGFAVYDDGEESEDDAEVDPSDPRSWMPEVNLRISDAGNLKTEPYNLERILENDPTLKGRIGFNEFNRIFEKTERMAWDFEYRPEWTDTDTFHLQSYINTVYDVVFSSDRILGALAVVSSRNRFHPVKDFIRSEEWDGEKRVENLFIDYLGAKDNDYTREVTRLWFAAAVARIYQPGIKFDYVPVLEGRQGIGKSTLIDNIAGDWFTDSLSSLDGNKDDLQAMSRVWIAELGELSSMKKTDIDSMKRFISAREDIYRPPYGKQPIVQRRHTVFIGSTNQNGYLTDVTGNRRWLPIVCNKHLARKNVFDNSVRESVGQLWAEAFDLYQTEYKDKLDLTPEGHLAAKQAQKGSETENVIKTKTEEYLSIDKPTDWHEWSRRDQQSYLVWVETNDNSLGDYGSMEIRAQDKMTPTEVFENVFQDGFRSKASDSSTIQKIGTVMVGMDEWEKKQFRVDGSRKWGYVKLEQKVKSRA